MARSAGNRTSPAVIYKSWFIGESPNALRSFFSAALMLWSNSTTVSPGHSALRISSRVITSPGRASSSIRIFKGCSCQQQSPLAVLQFARHSVEPKGAEADNVCMRRQIRNGVHIWHTKVLPKMGFSMSATPHTVNPGLSRQKPPYVICLPCSSAHLRARSKHQQPAVAALAETFRPQPPGRQPSLIAQLKLMSSFTPYGRL